MGEDLRGLLDKCGDVLRAVAPLLAEAADLIDRDELATAGHILERARAQLWEGLGADSRVGVEAMGPLSRAMRIGGWDDVGPYLEILHKPVGGLHTMVLASFGNPKMAQIWAKNEELAAAKAKELRAEVPGRLREMAEGWAHGVPVFFR